MRSQRIEIEVRHMDRVIKELKNISAKLDQPKPKPKRGKWENVMTEESANFGRHLFVCSECNYAANYFVGGSEEWWDTEKPNFCPSCGADMRGDE